MLLTPEQRKHRAGALLGMALGLVLLERGWQLETQPGSFYLYRGQEKLDVSAILEELIAGKLAADSWKAKCIAWGISHAMLAPRDAPDQVEAGNT